MKIWEHDISSTLKYLHLLIQNKSISNRVLWHVQVVPFPYHHYCHKNHLSPLYNGCIINASNCHRYNNIWTWKLTFINIIIEGDLISTKPGGVITFPSMEFWCNKLFFWFNFEWGSLLVLIPMVVNFKEVEKYFRLIFLDYGLYSKILRNNE